MMIVAGSLAKAAKEDRPGFLLRLLLVDDGNGGRGVRNGRRRRRGGSGGHHGHGRHHRRLLLRLLRRRRHAVRGRRLGRWRVRIYFGGGGRVLSISAGIPAAVLAIRWHDGRTADQLDTAWTTTKRYPEAIDNRQARAADGQQSESPTGPSERASDVVTSQQSQQTNGARDTKKEFLLLLMAM